MTLTEEKMIAFLPAENPGDLADRFEGITPTQFREPGFCRDYVNSPDVISTTVCFEGEPYWFLAYRVTSDGGLWVDIALSLVTRREPLHPGRTLFDVGDALAKAHGCKYQRFTTSRPGLVKSAQANGFKAEAVLMTKGL